jgi:hypothetical protein
MGTKDDDDLVEDAAETAAEVAVQAAGTAGLIALGAPGAFVALLPVLPFLAKRFARHLTRRQARRLKTYSEHVLRGDETLDEFRDWIASRMIADPEGVEMAFCETAEAVADRADEVAVPSIAVLARAYAAGHLPKWFYRGALDMLLSLRETEFHQARGFVAELATIDEGVWLTVDGDMFPGTVSVRGTDSRRKITVDGNLEELMAVFKRHGLAEQALRAGTLAMDIRRQVAKWLHEILVG